MNVNHILGPDPSDDWPTIQHKLAQRTLDALRDEQFEGTYIDLDHETIDLGITGTEIAAMMKTWDYEVGKDEYDSSCATTSVFANFLLKMIEQDKWREKKAKDSMGDGASYPLAVAPTPVAPTPVAPTPVAPAPMDAKDDTATTELPEGLPFRTGPQVLDEVTLPTYIAPYLPEGAIVDLFGNPKEAGKTTFMLSLVSALQRGEVFMGSQVQKTPVVYLTEQSSSIFAMSASRAGLKLADDLHVLYRCEITRLGKGWIEIMQGTIEHAVAVGAKIIVVDTMPAFYDVADENSAPEAYRALAPFDEAKRLGITVVAVRHERKSGGTVVTGGRGSMVISANADVIMRISRVPKGPANLRRIEVTGRFDEDTVFVAFDDDGYNLVGDPSSPETTIMAVLRASDEAMTVMGIDAQLKASGYAFGDTKLRMAIKGLADEGQVVEESLSGKGSPKGYRAAP